MNLLSVSLRNIRIRAVSSTLTAVSVVVAVGLYAAILLMADQTERNYKASLSGYKTIVGTKDASALELCLNTIFHAGTSPGTVRTEVYELLRSDRLGDRTDMLYVIPQARGDTFSTKQYPVLGTVDAMFHEFGKGLSEASHTLEFQSGGPWEYGHDDFLATAEAIAAYENAAMLESGNGPQDGDTVIPIEPEWKKAVIGARVARVLGMGLGDTITPVHGKAGEYGAHAHEAATCEVSGVLAPTGTPIDRSVFIPLGVQLVLGGHRAVDPKIPEPGKPPPEYTRGDVKLNAIICYPVHHMGPLVVRRAMAGNPYGQAAWPQEEIPKFLRTIGNVADALRVIAWLVLAVACIAVAVAMYNTMNERRREIAIMRSLGARRLQISAIIVQEAALLSFAGAVFGVLLCHLTAYLSQNAVEDLTGIYVEWDAFSLSELWLILGVTVLGALAGLLPAVKGSMTQVADNLAPTT